MKQHPRVTIVHERFTEYGGSEAVVEALARRWPSSMLFAPIGRGGVLSPACEARSVTTGLNRLLRGPRYAHFLPALPVAMRRSRLPAADVIIASHHAFATQVAVGAATPVLAYVHTPARWVWDPALRKVEGPGLKTAGLAAFSAAYRPFDRQAAQHVHTLVANSTCVAERIRTWWGREAQVIAPPVDTEYYSFDPTTRRQDFFLLAGRLVPYKRPDLAVRAAARAGVKLVVAGEGRALSQIEGLAGPGTTFVGRVSDAELRDLFRRCRALLMPGLEDFGIVPVEAQACGAPVIGVQAGGTLDTVLPGVTGEWVPLTVPSLEVETWASALAGFDAKKFDSQRIRAHAETFSHGNFASAMSDVVVRVLNGPRPFQQAPVVDLRSPQPDCVPAS